MYNLSFIFTDKKGGWADERKLNIKIQVKMGITCHIIERFWIPAAITYSA